MTNAEFETIDGKLHINGKKVLRGWESFTGWFWFATKIECRQDSLFPDGQIVKNDTIYYGYVQGLENEWGLFSLAELEREKLIWEIGKENLPISGRRDR